MYFPSGDALAPLRPSSQSGLRQSISAWDVAPRAGLASPGGALGGSRPHVSRSMPASRPESRSWPASPSPDGGDGSLLAAIRGEDGMDSLIQQLRRDFASEGAARTGSAPSRFVSHQNDRVALIEQGSDTSPSPNSKLRREYLAAVAQMERAPRRRSLQGGNVAARGRKQQPAKEDESKDAAYDDDYAKGEGDLATASPRRKRANRNKTSSRLRRQLDQRIETIRSEMHEDALKKAVSNQRIVLPTMEIRDRQGAPVHSKKMLLLRQDEKDEGSLLQKLDAASGIYASTSSVPELESLEGLLGAQSSQSIFSRSGLGTPQERKHRARTQKQEHRFDTALKKFNAMRSEPPRTMLERLDALATEVLKSHTESGAFLSSSTSVSRLHAGSSGSWSLESKSPLTKQEVLARIHSGDPLASALGPESPSHLARSLTWRAIPRTPKWKEMALVAAHKKRATKRWRLLIGITNVWMIFFRHRKLHGSIEILKPILAQLSEWARLKSAMLLLKRRLRTVLVACRASVQQKKRRLVDMAEQWQQCEDDNLVLYFERRAYHYLQDKEDATIQAELGGTQGIHHHIKFHYDWRSLRIPAAERDAMIRRYYEEQLKIRMRMLDSIHDVMAGAYQEIEWGKDLQGFVATRLPRRLRSRLVVGDSPSRTSGLVSPSSPEPDSPSAMLSLPTHLPELTKTAEWWKMPEETILDLIAFSADHLRGSKPFDLHPVNMHSGPLVPCPLFRRPPQPTGLSMPMNTAARTSDFAGLDSSVPDEKPASVELKPDVEELMQGFSLRQLRKGVTSSPATSGASTVRMGSGLEQLHEKIVYPLV